MENKTNYIESSIDYNDYMQFGFQINAAPTESLSKINFHFNQLEKLVKSNQLDEKYDIYKTTYLNDIFVNYGDENISSQFTLVHHSDITPFEQYTIQGNINNKNNSNLGLISKSFNNIENKNGRPLFIRPKVGEKVNISGISKTIAFELLPKPFFYSTSNNDPDFILQKLLLFPSGIFTGSILLIDQVSLDEVVNKLIENNQKLLFNAAFTLIPKRNFLINLDLNKIQTLKSELLNYITVNKNNGEFAYEAHKTSIQKFRIFEDSFFISLISTQLFIILPFFLIFSYLLFILAKRFIIIPSKESNLFELFNESNAINFALFSYFLILSVNFGLNIIEGFSLAKVLKIQDLIIWGFIFVNTVYFLLLIDALLPKKFKINLNKENGNGRNKLKPIRTKLLADILNIAFMTYVFLLLLLLWLLFLLMQNPSILIDIPVFFQFSSIIIFILPISVFIFPSLLSKITSLIEKGIKYSSSKKINTARFSYLIYKTTKQKSSKLMSLLFFLILIFFIFNYSNLAIDDELQDILKENDFFDLVFISKENSFNNTIESELREMKGVLSVSKLLVIGEDILGIDPSTFEKTINNMESFTLRTGISGQKLLELKNTNVFKKCCLKKYPYYKIWNSSSLELFNKTYKVETTFKDLQFPSYIDNNLPLWLINLNSVNMSYFKSTQSNYYFQIFYVIKINEKVATQDSLTENIVAGFPFISIETKNVENDQYYMFFNILISEWGLNLSSLQDFLLVLLISLIMLTITTFLINLRELKELFKILGYNDYLLYRLALPPLFLLVSVWFFVSILFSYTLASSLTLLIKVAINPIKPIFIVKPTISSIFPPNVLIIIAFTFSIMSLVLIYFYLEHRKEDDVFS